MKVTDGKEGSENHASVRADGTQEVSLTDLAAALYAILEAITRPISQEPGTGRTRVTVDNSPAVTISSGTVTTVTSMTQFGGAPIWDILGKPLDRNLWNGSVRMRIS